MRHLDLFEWVVLGAIASVFALILVAVLSSVFGDPCETVNRCQKQTLISIIDNVPYYKCEQYIVEPRDIEACAEKGRD